jgi:hypothetical protein
MNLISSRQQSFGGRAPQGINSTTDQELTALLCEVQSTGRADNAKLRVIKHAVEKNLVVSTTASNVRWELLKDGITFLAHQMVMMKRNMVH